MEGRIRARNRVRMSNRVRGEFTAGFTGEVTSSLHSTSRVVHHSFICPSMELPSNHAAISQSLKANAFDAALIEQVQYEVPRNTTLASLKSLSFSSRSMSRSRLRIKPTTSSPTRLSLNCQYEVNNYCRMFIVSMIRYSFYPAQRNELISSLILTKAYYYLSVLCLHG